MSFALVFKVLNQVFLDFMFMTCASDLTTWKYWTLAEHSTSTLFSTFLFTAFILISKGFGIARTMLDRNEVTTIALVMGIVYLTYSAYFIAED
jgi:hypothetical protein